MTERLTRDGACSAVLESASALAESFRKNPYRYLFEADIQAELFCTLRQKLPQTFTVDFNKTPYELSHVYLEYQKYGDGRGRLDLAVLDPQPPVPPVPSPGSSLEQFLYKLSVWIGIELKYTVIGYKFNIDNGINDLKKLRRHLGYSEATKRNGLAIAFIQEDKGITLSDGIPAETIDSLDFLYLVSRHGLRKVTVPWETVSADT